MSHDGQKEDRMWLAWQEAAPRIYDEMNYTANPLIGYCNRHTHQALEKPFGPERHFAKVLEVGCGTGEHLEHVRHPYDQYFLTDLSPRMLERAKQRHRGKPGLVFEVQDAGALSYPDAMFDRLVSVYTLEHLPDPHLVIKEWARVVRPNGIISLAIPAEGGIAWNLGRYLTTRRSFRKKGLDLDYIIAREHINPAYRLLALIRYYFPRASLSWFPLGVPSINLNLVISCHLAKDSHCRAAWEAQRG